MRTLAAFIQRLQDDPAFERQAQTFDNGEDLIAFVKREGYDFTLEQLMSEFARQEQLPPKTAAPAPADVSPSPPPSPKEAAIPQPPETLPRQENSPHVPEKGNDDCARGPALEVAPQSTSAMVAPEAEEEPRAGLFRGGGGRHRGFAPERLKSISGEET